MKNITATEIEQLSKMTHAPDPVLTPLLNRIYSLVDYKINLTPYHPTTCASEIIPSERENKMSYSDYDEDCGCCPTPRALMSDDAKARDYLVSRLCYVSEEKRSEALKSFHIVEDIPPTTPKELADRLAAGKYTVKDATDDNKNHYYGSLKSYIVWRDPATPADEAGFKAFEALLDKQRTLAEDAIRIKAPADGLTALQAFETWTA